MQLRDSGFGVVCLVASACVASPKGLVFDLWLWLILSYDSGDTGLDGS